MQLSALNWFASSMKNDLYSKEKITGNLEIVRSYHPKRGYPERSIKSILCLLSPDRKGM